MLYNGFMKFTTLIPAQGHVAIIGGGGKTGLMEILEKELHQSERPVLTTVTTRLGRGQLPHLRHIEAQNPAEVEEAAHLANAGERLLLGGPPDKPDKISGLPRPWFTHLRQSLSPQAVLLIEADGSAGRPLKGHLAHEPVFPPRPFFLVAVVGLSVLTRPWPEAVHRPEVLKSHIELPAEDQQLSPAQVARFIGAAWAGLKPDLIFLNQADILVTPAEKTLGRELALLLAAQGWSVTLGSLKTNRLERIY